MFALHRSGTAKKHEAFLRDQVHLLMHCSTLACSEMAKPSYSQLYATWRAVSPTPGWIPTPSRSNLLAHTHKAHYLYNSIPWRAEAHIEWNFFQLLPRHTILVGFYEFITQHEDTIHSTCAFTEGTMFSFILLTWIWIQVKTGSWKKQIRRLNKGILAEAGRVKPKKDVL